jgi:ATP-dependent helicase Lhr and Lhr-like helicase
VFVNTRAQAELCFHALWRLNDDNLPIALHHGSLAVEQRRKVEAAMAAGRLRAVVATSSLDLGIDWGEVDQVVQVGAPKGASRLLQRIGRANHRLDEPSRACWCRPTASRCWNAAPRSRRSRRRARRRRRERPGGLDVLASTCWGAPAPRPSPGCALRRGAPGGALRRAARARLRRRARFVATGGYALQAYDRFRRCSATSDGTLAHVRRRSRGSYRMNVGTIVEAPMLKVVLSSAGARLGEVEEWFVPGLEPATPSCSPASCCASRACARPRSTSAWRAAASRGAGLCRRPHAADDPSRGAGARILPIPRWGRPAAAGAGMAAPAAAARCLPRRDGLLVETFPRGGKQFLVAYCFEGRNAHQTLGMLLTQADGAAGLAPLGFVATDYVMAIWSLTGRATSSAVRRGHARRRSRGVAGGISHARRTFRNIAVVAGLIERTIPGRRRRGRQVTFSSDLIYDVLRKHEPDHVLLRATRAEAAAG